MKAFVRLEAKDGEAVYLVPDDVESITPWIAPSGALFTQVMTVRTKVIVKGRPDDVFTALMAAEEKEGK